MTARLFLLLAVLACFAFVASDVISANDAAAPFEQNMAANGMIDCGKGVMKEIKKEGSGAQLVKGKEYTSEVTLYIENADHSLTPAGWSTKDTGAFKFSPGVNLIEGWSIGALSMKVGERAMIHVPAHLGYGAAAQGQKGRGWYIPGNSNLCFDLEITA